MSRFTIAAFILPAFGGVAPADDWVELFNGKDFSGWVIDGPTEYKEKGEAKPLWTVEDGLIRTAGRGFGFLRYHKRFSDFRLHVEYRMVKGANAGIGIRTGVFDPKKSTATRPSFFAYEVQLLDDSDKKADKHSTGSLYRYVAPTALANKPAPEWNAVDIECVGSRIQIWFNDKEVMDVDQTTVPEIKSKPLSGYVCLQSHSRQVEFRNVKMRDLAK
jgi:hypothetical protein